MDFRLAQLLLGERTHEAGVLISQIPALEPIAYDPGIATLLQYQFDYENAPVKQEIMTPQHYEIALTLLTPPVAQNQAHAYRRSSELSSDGLWALGGHEISALHDVANGYAAHIVFDQGLSLPLYELCNRPEIMQELSSEFLGLLKTDPNFATKASPELSKRVAAAIALVTPIRQRKKRLEEEAAHNSVFHAVSSVKRGPDLLSSPAHSEMVQYTSPYYVGYDDAHQGAGHAVCDQGIMPEKLRPTYLTKVPRVSIKFKQYLYYTSLIDSQTLFGSNSEEDGSDHTLSSDSDSEEERTVPVLSSLKSHSRLRTAPPVENSQFWLRAMQFCLTMGGICAVVAVLTCPPVAATLGLTAVFGVAATDVAVTATCLAGASALLVASMFAVKLVTDEPVSDRPNLGLRPRA